jgi:GPI mannosyltransferase 3
MSSRNARACFLVAVLLLAVVSENPFQLDEHFQILEFAAFKAGRTPAAWLPWEYAAEMRPWLMPAFVYPCMRGLAALGVSDPFILTLALRGFSGVLGALATFRLVAYTERSLFAHEAQRDALAKALQRFVFTAAFVPYLCVRFSSEGISGALFVLAFCALEDRACSHRGEWLAGAIMALSIHCRYQTGLMVLGYALWRVRYARFPLRAGLRIAFGFIAGLAAGSALDAWGYGHAAVPFLNYVRLNVFEGVAAAFSTEPWYAYLYLPITNLFAVAAALSLLGSLVFWLRFPQHVYTWLMAPSFIGFSVLGHKEERFLFPLMLFAACCVVPAFAMPAPEGSRWQRFTGAAWKLRSHAISRILWSINLAALCALCIYPAHWREHAPIAKYLYRNLRADDVVLTRDTDTTRLPLFRGSFATRVYDTGCALRAGEYMLTGGSEPPDDIHAELVYQEWPLPKQHGRAFVERSLESVRDIFGPAILRPSWMSLYRIREPRPGVTCKLHVFEPMATEPPKKPRER